MNKNKELGEKYTTITSQAQYEKYKEIRKSYSHYISDTAKKTYDHLTVLIVNWDIKQEPGLVEHKIESKKLTKKAQ